VQWQLLKAVVASPAALACGQKRLGVANYDKKVTSWWNREVKNPTRAKEVTYKKIPKYDLMRIMGINWIQSLASKQSVLVNQTTPAPKNMILLDTSQTKILSYSAMKGIMKDISSNISTFF